MKSRMTAGMWPILMVAGCTVMSDPAPGPDYTPPEEAGLISIRAYPDADSVCRVMGESALTADYLDHMAVLIGCPAHEIGAIRDQLVRGAEPLDNVGDWLLLSVPL